MKDTLYIAGFVAVVVGFWFYLQKTDFGTPNPANAVLSQQNFTQTPASNGSKGNEGRRQTHDSATASNGATEGDSGSASEVEGLPSIYSPKHEAVKQAAKQNARGRKGKLAKKSRGKAGKVASNGKKMIHGVPLDQWIEWNKNRLRLGEVPSENDGGLRLFVQCMEIKKGASQAVTQAECKKLTAKSQGIPTAPTY